MREEATLNLAPHAVFLYHRLPPDVNTQILQLTYNHIFSDLKPANRSHYQQITYVLFLELLIDNYI